LAQAQIYLNQRYDFNKQFPSRLKGVLPTNSSVYIAGMALDSNGYFNTLFASVNKEGNMIGYKLYNLLDEPPGPQTFYIFSSINFVGPNKICAFPSISNYKIAKMNFDVQHDTMTYSEHLPLLDTYCSPTDWVQTTDSGFCIVYNTGFLPASYSNSRIGVLRLDKYDTVKWHRVYDLPMGLSSGSVLQCPDGGFLIGGHIFDFSENWNYKEQGFILKVDSLGEVVWDYYTPDNQITSPVFDMLLTGDDGIIVLAADGIEDGGAATYLYYYPTIFKLDSSRNTVWKTRIGNGRYGALDSYFEKVVPANEGDGYVAAGSLHFRMDSFYYINGWLAKVSLDGDSLWARAIRVLADSVINDYHHLVDIKPDPSGQGYWLCGEAQGKEFPFSQAWLVSVDNYGCVVPGCHLASTSAEPGKPESKMLLYPSPAGSTLNIFLPAGLELKNKVSLQIVNSEGKVVKRFEFAYDGTDLTLVCPVENLVAGVYFCIVAEVDMAGKLSGKFVKE
jgi:hypothetical protein